MAGNGGKIKVPAGIQHEKRRESGNMRCRRIINRITFEVLCGVIGAW
jgi:hypothetical protein